MSESLSLGLVLSCIWLFVTPRSTAHQAPLSMGFSRKEYWKILGYHALLQGILPTQGLNSNLLHCQAVSLPLPREALSSYRWWYNWFEMGSWLQDFSHLPAGLSSMASVEKQCSGPNFRRPRALRKTRRFGSHVSLLPLLCIKLLVSYCYHLSWLILSKPTARWGWTHGFGLMNTVLWPAELINNRRFLGCPSVGRLLPKSSSIK